MVFALATPNKKELQIGFKFFQEKLKSYLKRSMFKKRNFYENINILQKKGEKNG